MAEVVVTAVAKEAVQSCFKVAGHYISYTRKYKRNMENLKVELKKLEDTTITVLREVDIAENNAEDIRQDVIGWLQKCEELKSKVNESFETVRPFNISCLCYSCPNLKSRYLASTEAAEIIHLITQHLEEGRFDQVGQQPRLGQLPLLSPGEFHGFGSRMVIMKEVMDGLKEDSISIIGLCGMGGVGKTTLVKEIVEVVKRENLFDEVAFVVVSQDKNVKMIQDELASRLGLHKIEEERDIQRRSELLYKRLMDEKKRILVILDDIWQELNLRSVGIPVHGDRKGFKILLTSRFDSVCADMKVQKRLQVGILSKDEAWLLFKMIAEISDDTIPDVAEEVSQECAGLPLAIVTVGKSLRNKKVYAFRDVLRKLRDTSRSNTSRIHVVLYVCIKSSYDYLETDEHRLLLLLCSLFPEDCEIQIEDLVRYARGLFDTLESMGEARDRVEAIVDELMNSYLLLHGEKEKCVKLHDVVRDVCLSIASKFSDVHISLKFDDLVKVLPSLKSRKFRLMRLVNKEAFWKSGFSVESLRLEETTDIEMDFYEEMKELRVLEVNHITISFPSALQFMINLRTLSLDYCRLQGDFAGIGSLKNLRVLSFFHSILEMFPTEIAELTNLQCLDLRFLNCPATLPFGMLSCLKELEELYLGVIVPENTESLKEVHSLSKLHTVQFVYYHSDSCSEVLLQNLNLLELTRFEIVQSNHVVADISYQIRENMLDLWGWSVAINVHLLKGLMWRVKCFYLVGAGMPNVVDVLGEDNGFPNLKDLKLKYCDMKYLVDATNHLAKCAFSKLETLYITEASQLEELIRGEYPLETLSRSSLNVRDLPKCPLGNLRKLKVHRCDKIKSLFLNSMVKYLRNLDEVEVQLCPIFERIVTRKKNEVNYSEAFLFPNLRLLQLNNLPEFTSLGPGSGLTADYNQVMLPELERLSIELYDGSNGREAMQQELCCILGCSLPKVQWLTVYGCNYLLTITKSGLIHGFQHLVRLLVGNCFNLQVIFDFEDIMAHISAEHREIALLGQLEELYLFSLSNLKHIWRMLPKGTPVFQNLKKLAVKWCDSIRFLLTPAVTSMLVHLEEIELEDNKLMEAMIERGEINMANDGEEFQLGKIVLPKLRSLNY